MQDLSHDVIAAKSIKGVLALVSRTFLIQILSIATSFVLTIFLDPGSFGVFFVVSSIVIFFNYFQDIGLAASLIQKKEEPTTSELRTTFTTQLLLVLLIITPAFIFAKDIALFYKLDQNGYMLFLSLLISFFLSSLRTIPTVLLERRLQFQKLVIPQIAENIVYNVALIFFSINGFGITTFTIAVLARSIVGLFLTYIIQPWEIGFAKDVKAFKKLVSFGLPFQTNSILALIKDDLLTIYLGKILPYSQVGYIGFSQKWAFMPLRLIMDNAIKITFPSFSRLQHDKNALKVGVEKSLFFTSAFLFPSAIGMILLSDDFVRFFPRYNKWEPALSSLIFFSLNSMLSSISTPLTNFLNAIGKVKITLYFMIFWTIATWVSTLLLININGYIGVSQAAFIVSLSSVFVIITTRSHIKFSLFKPIIRQLLASLIMGGLILFAQQFISNLFSLLIVITLSSLFYLLILFLVAKDELMVTIKYIIKMIRK